MNKIDTSWTLFLDRDGVINEQIIDGYVTHPDELILKPEAIEGLKILQHLFGHLFVVTNQQGVGKGICTSDEVEIVHHNMLQRLNNEGVKIDAIYYCPHLASLECKCRKPNIGMAEQAKRDYPETDFSKSIMVGDSLSDLVFGKRCGMVNVYIYSAHKTTTSEILLLADFCCESLLDFAKLIS